MAAVTIQDEPEEILTSPHQDDSDATYATSHSAKRHRASISGKKLSGRPSIDRSTSSISLAQQITNLDLGKTEAGDVSEDVSLDPQTLLSQVVNWLQEEKAKQALPR